MKVISFITESSVIRHMLEHLELWQMKHTRDPPVRCALPEVTYEPYDDGWPGYEEAYALAKIKIELQGSEGELCAESLLLDCLP